MDKEAQTQCFTTHLIERDGTFNAYGLDTFIKQVKLGECGLSYAIVAIMGPQSSGKSTLLNHLFHTNFREMDASKGRHQTTEGIWIARCTGIEPFTIVMDLEGTDGRERGEDGTLFEKQSALFAIALSDIMLINMWCHDIGREHAANKPLLKIVFQVMLRLCSPRKTTLMFIIRDTTRTPIEKLDLDLRKDIKEIWDSVPKAEAHKHTQLSEFFNVEVVALCSYEHEEENFKKQVANLRQKFFQSIAPGRLAGDRRLVVPGSGFSLSAQNIWKDIKENKDLNLPSYRVMVANVRCEEIADEKYSSFAENQDWVDISEAVKSHPVADFGKKLSSLLEYCFSIYDEEVIYYEETVRSEKRKQLEERLMKLVQPATKLMLKYIRSERLDEFKGTFNNALKEGQGFEVAARDCTMKSMRLFDEQCKDATSYQAISDYTQIRDKLSHDLDLHITEVRAAKLNELSTQYEALGGQVEAHLKEASDNTWPAIKTLFDRQTIAVVNSFSSALSSFKMDEQEKGDMISKLKDYGRGVVEGKAREAAGKVKYLMKDRFEFIFCYDDDSMPQDWTENHDIQAMAKAALSSSLKLLSVLAAIRLDGESDRIWNTLKQGTTTSPHLLASSAWEEDPEMKKTLITPVQCKSFWDQFKQETEKIITQAISIQKGNMKKKKKIGKHVVTTIAGTASVVGIVTVATATTGNVVAAVVVAALGGAALGVVVAGALVGVAAHNALASLKNMALGV